VGASLGKPVGQRQPKKKVTLRISCHLCALRAPRQWVGLTGRQGSVRHHSKLFPTSGIREQSPIETYQVECFPGLAPEEPNISVILIDDVGNGLPSTYGGEVHTPALDRIAGSVIVVPTISDIVVTQKETNIEA
jgi:hypothetical protein